MQRGRGVKLLTMMMIELMTRTHCMNVSMIFPGVYFLYMSPPLIRGERIGMV